MLDTRKVKVGEERQSRKAPLSRADAQALLDSVTWVIVARGKTSRRLKREQATLDDLKGHTGGFRAPIVRRGKTLLVGFNEAELEKLIR
ncbi:MAG: hypothetical protein LC796_16460 [Acidobacteria bacterium]|nr:hypothetical protein [Acidobacteriota bacterium]MCA1612280.1 hypothetical protein [Acidobacteriota bacterium]